MPLMEKTPIIEYSFGETLPFGGYVLKLYEDGIGECEIKSLDFNKGIVRKKFNFFISSKKVISYAEILNMKESFGLGKECFGPCPDGIFHSLALNYKGKRKKETFSRLPDLFTATHSVIQSLRELANNADVADLVYTFIKTYEMTKRYGRESIFTSLEVARDADYIFSSFRGKEKEKRVCSDLFERLEKVALESYKINHDGIEYLQLKPAVCLGDTRVLGEPMFLDLHLLPIKVYALPHSSKDDLILIKCGVGHRFIPQVFDDFYLLSYMDKTIKDMIKDFLLSQLNKLTDKIIY